ncbi:MAG: hypothetical protein ACJ71Y_20895 [Blastococcus sp.]|jgi:hypothetical protein
MRFVLLAAVLGAGVACPALAGAPGTLDPSPGAEAGWSLAGPGDVADFRFAPIPGADYAFGMDGTAARPGSPSACRPPAGRTT